MATRALDLRRTRPASQQTAARPARLTVLRRASAGRSAVSRRARLVALGAAAVIAVALWVVAAAQAEVASQQLRIDTARQQLSNAVMENANLQLQRANLEAPTRILQVAEHRLGMVAPGTVTYLAPVRTGPSVAASQLPGRP